jgi:hypothetical protein
MKMNSKEKRILLKCAEELNELSLELLQCVNKPNKDNWNKILEEIIDVEKYIVLLKKIKND